MTRWGKWGALVLVAGLAATPATAEDIVRLRRGYYVRADIPCDRASTATTILFTGKSFGARCKLEQIETAGQDVRISQTCHDRGYVVRTSQSYRLISEREFTLGLDGQDIPHRLCPQSDMPLPWAAADLSGVLRCSDEG